MKETPCELQEVAGKPAAMKSLRPAREKNERGEFKTEDMQHMKSTMTNISEYIGRLDTVKS